MSFFSVFALFSYAMALALASGLLWRRVCSGLGLALVWGQHHAALHPIQTVTYGTKNNFSRCMDNTICLYSVVQGRKAIDNQNPQSRFLRIEKSTCYNRTLSFSKVNVNIIISSIFISHCCCY